jgi:hypothetical protein
MQNTLVSQLDKGMQLLHRCLQLAPCPNVALALGYQRAGDLPQAKELCHAGFKRIEPGMDIGVDLADEIRTRRVGRM